MHAFAGLLSLCVAAAWAAPRGADSIGASRGRAVLHEPAPERLAPPMTQLVTGASLPAARDLPLPPVPSGRSVRGRRTVTPSGDLVVAGERVRVFDGDTGDELLVSRPLPEPAIGVVAGRSRIAVVLMDRVTWLDADTGAAVRTEWMEGLASLDTDGDLWAGAADDGVWVWFPDGTSQWIEHKWGVAGVHDGVVTLRRGEEVAAVRPVADPSFRSVYEPRAPATAPPAWLPSERARWAWSPDGRKVAIADRGVWVYSADGVSLGELRGHVWYTEILWTRDGALWSLRPSSAAAWRPDGPPAGSPHAWRRSGWPTWSVEDREGVDVLVASSLGSFVELDSSTGAHERFAVCRGRIRPVGDWARRACPALRGADGAVVYVARDTLWLRRPGEPRQELESLEGAQVQLRLVGPDRVWVQSDRHARHYDLRTGERVVEIRAPDGGDLAWSMPEFAAVDVGGSLLRTDYATGEQALFPTLQRSPRALAVDPEAAAFWTAHEDGVVRMWDTATGDLRDLIELRLDLTALAVSPRWLVAGAADGSVLAVRRGARARIALQGPRPGGRSAAIRALDLTGDSVVSKDASGRVVPFDLLRERAAASDAPDARRGGLEVRDGLAAPPGGSWVGTTRAIVEARSAAGGTVVATLSDGSVARWDADGRVLGRSWAWHDGSWASWDARGALRGAGPGLELVGW